MRLDLKKKKNLLLISLLAKEIHIDTNFWVYFVLCCFKSDPRAPYICLGDQRTDGGGEQVPDGRLHQHEQRVQQVPRSLHPHHHIHPQGQYRVQQVPGGIESSWSHAVFTLIITITLKVSIETAWSLAIDTLHYYLHPQGQ